MPNLIKEATALELTCLLLKPDVVRRKMVQNLLQELKSEERVVIKQMVRLTLTPAEVSLFYGDHVNKSYFPDLQVAMVSGPLVALVLEGRNAISVIMAFKEIVRATHHWTGGPFNGIHCSDGPDSADREVSLIRQFLDVMQME